MDELAAQTTMPRHLMKVTGAFLCVPLTIVGIQNRVVPRNCAVSNLCGTITVLVEMHDAPLRGYT